MRAVGKSERYAALRAIKLLKLRHEVAVFVQSPINPQ